MNLSQMRADDLASELNRVSGYGCMHDYLDVVLGDDLSGACVHAHVNEHGHMRTKGVRVRLPNATGGKSVLFIDTARRKAVASRMLVNGDVEYGESPLCQDTAADIEDYVKRAIERGGIVSEVIG